MRRALTLSLALVSLLALCGRAGAASPERRCPSGASTGGIIFGSTGAKIISVLDAPVCETGRINVTFASRAGTGCTGGPCGYHGTYTWRPRGIGDLELITSLVHGRRHRTAVLILGGGLGPALQTAVERVSPAGTTACSDSGDDSTWGLYLLTARQGRLPIDLAHAGEPVFGSRCAGPLDPDLAGAMPSAALAFGRALHGGARIDLRQARSFTAHGFSGTARSTLVLRVGRAVKVGGWHSAPPDREPRYRELTVVYRLERLGGEAVSSVRSSADPAACGPFDACGLGGTLTWAPHLAHPHDISLVATAPIGRPMRDLRAAVGLSRRGNPSGVRVEGFDFLNAGGSLTAALTQGAACRDVTSVLAGSLQIGIRRGRLTVSLHPRAAAAVDPLRTRCPGPELGQRPLVAGRFPRSVLRRPTLQLPLAGNAFTDGPYDVRPRSILALTLQRVRVMSKISG